MPNIFSNHLSYDPKKERFCILNKKYPEAEYRELKRKIIGYMKRTGEYGEFFPIAACPFGYNETMAMDAFYMTKESALSKGFKWYEEDRGETKPQTYEIPDSIFDVAGTLPTEYLACDCGKNFKIISQEFSFYKKMQIPIPKKCPSCRHKARMAKRNPLKLWQRRCTKCNTPIQTNYAPDKSETVYCEKCYLQEVY